MVARAKEKNKAGPQWAVLGVVQLKDSRMLKAGTPTKGGSHVHNWRS